MKRIDDVRLNKIREEVAQGEVEKNSYKDLCDWIGWEVSTNRDAQFKSISHWMKIEKTDKKYIISEIYDDTVVRKNFKKPGRKQKEVNPDDYKIKRPVGRPRKNKPLSDKELEKKQGFSLRFKTTAKYPEIACNILIHDILDNNGEICYTHDGLIKRLGMMDFNQFHNESYKKYITNNIDLYSFEYYVRSCCETVLRINILESLCRAKNILICKNAYYSYDCGIDDTKIVFCSDSTSAKMDSIIEETLEEWELNGYYELSFPKGEKGRYKAKAAKTAIDQKALELIGWERWGKGIKFSINPNIPILSIKHLEYCDIEIDRKHMNELIKERVKDLLYKKAQKFTEYNPDVKELVPAIGTGSNISKEAYIDRCNRIDYLIDKYIVN